MKYIRNTIIAVLILTVVTSCCVAAFASSTYTAYINRQTYVYKSASTSSARVAVGVNTRIYVVGTKGSYYKIKNSDKTVTGYVLKSCVSRSKVTTTADGTDTSDSSDTSDSTASWRPKVVKLDWFKTGKNVLKRGSYGYIYDIDTGITVRIKRMGGTNHADVEPATASDTAKLKKISGGKFSWVSHAVILNAGGKYVACGINTMPHGSQTIRNNNYNGQFCLHMVGSLTHGSTSVNAAHQASIDRAYNWAH